jgi:hypothetical protein
MRRLGWTAAILLVTSTVLASGCAAQSPRVEAQQRELSFIVKKLELHPLLRNSAKRQAFTAFADRELRLAESPLPNWRIIEIEERLAAWFGDPHTFASALVADYPGSQALPLAFDWLADGLVTVRMPDTPSSVATGDRVLDISGVPAATIAQRLSALIGGDAIFVQHLGADELPVDSTLETLGLVRPGGNVSLRLEGADGKDLTIDLTPRPRTGDQWFKAEQIAFLRFAATYELPAYELSRGHTNRADWTWYVTPRYGFFQLTSCVYDAAYQQAVAAFFRQVAVEHSPVVVLDLQQNGGGDSNVAIPWLEHLSPMFRASDVRLNTADGYAPTLPSLQPIFAGRLYVLQSGGTFSSAMWLSDALTGPGLGVRVGSAVGESTAGYGNVAEYQTPVLHVYLQVSKQWYATIKGKAEATLPAEIPLDLTVEDVQHGVNPVARWLATLP